MPNHTFDDNSQTLAHKMTTGGLCVFDAQRTTGEMTFTLQISLDGGVTYADYRGADGELRQKTVDAGSPHCRFEELGKQGDWYRVISSGAASTPSVLGSLDTAQAAHRVAA